MDRARWSLLLAGVGLGGFFDGIVLHQLLQWHHMVSNRVATDTVADLETNVVGDGIFHAVTYVLTGLGVVLLWSAARRGQAPRDALTVAGLLLFGWGLFNFADSILSHYTLRLHHIREDEHEAAWDAAFLVLSLVQMAGGWWLVRSRDRLREARGNASA
ncbi:MAG: DUF2243 domain-containing protein [Dehalococcoidia bacterium]|nr:DUF2243 domain-containing protein [Dehalococcoidia bacterium]